MNFQGAAVDANGRAASSVTRHTELDEFNFPNDRNSKSPRFAEPVNEAQGSRSPTTAPLNRRSYWEHDIREKVCRDIPRKVKFSVCARSPSLRITQTLLILSTVKIEQRVPKQKLDTAPGRNQSDPEELSKMKKKTTGSATGSGVNLHQFIEKSRNVAKNSGNYNVGSRVPPHFGVPEKNICNHPLGDLL